MPGDTGVVYTFGSVDTLGFAKPGLCFGGTLGMASGGSWYFLSDSTGIA